MELVQGGTRYLREVAALCPSTLTPGYDPNVFRVCRIIGRRILGDAAIISYQVMDRGLGWWFYRVLGFGGPTDLLEPLLDEIFEVAAAALPPPSPGDTTHRECRWWASSR